MTWAIVVSAAELEKDSPGLMETIERSVQMAALASSSRGGSDGGPSTSRAHLDGASTSRAGSSSTPILLEDDDDNDDSFDWSGAFK